MQVVVKSGRVVEEEAQVASAADVRCRGDVGAERQSEDGKSRDEVRAVCIVEQRPKGGGVGGRSSSRRGRQRRGASRFV